MEYVKLKVPATSANLGPGFDTLGLALNLHNIIEIRRSNQHKIILHGEGSNNKKVLSNNMFNDIFRYFYTKLNGKMDNFEFIFNNKIPISRGLGSSAAVIVTAIYAAYTMSNRQIHKNTLLNLAIKYEKHPDNITPCIFGGFCVAHFNNHRVTHIKKKMPNHLRAVLIVPFKPMSTNLSRKALPKQYSKEDTTFNIAQSSLLTASIFSENWQIITKAGKDRIHESQRMKIFPQLFDIKNKLLQLNPLMITLSGSGSTMFALFEYEKLKAINNLHQLFDKSVRIISCRLNNEGIKIIESH